MGQFLLWLLRNQGASFLAIKVVWGLNGSLVAENGDYWKVINEWAWLESPFND